MHVRKWDRNNDYDTLVSWWKAWEFGIVPKECLPPDGIIVEQDGKPLCAGGLYIGVGTEFAFMEWIVTDKNAESRKIHQALRICIDELINLGKSKGMKLIYTATKEQALQKRYEKYHNMVLTESDVRTFIRDLDGKYENDLTWISDDEQIEKRNK
jgi:hypothetical protein|tara:strand:+ start:248 stop:712 length:465 start_codon:yes stop_codon:yes gene_type:complete